MQPLRILIAEDDSMVALGLRAQLESLGHTVVGEAADGLEVVALAQQLRPDMVVMDLEMPKMNGIEATEVINERFATPVVALTAYSQPELVEKASQAGILAYLVKPVDGQSLSAAIEVSYARFVQIERGRQLSALNAIAATVAESLELETILNAALDRVLEVMNLDAGAVYLSDEYGQELKLYTYRGLSAGFVQEVETYQVGQGITGCAAQGKKPIVVEDVRTDPRVSRRPGEREGLACQVSVPLRSKEQVLGVMNVNGRRPRRFTPEEVALIAAIGQQIGVAVENARLYERVQQELAERKRAEEALHNALEESRQRQAEISALLEGSRAVLEYREFEEAARSIFDSCKSLIGATGGYVALLTEDGTENEVLFLDSGGRPCTVDPNLPMPTRGLREVAYRTAKAVYHNDFSKSEWVKYMPEGHVGLDNVLFAPLTIEGKAVGLLGLANKPGGFTEDDARMASAFGELAAIALLNSQTLEALEWEAGVNASIAELSSALISPASLEDISYLVLEHAQRLTGSEFGFVGYIDPQTGYLVSPTLTRDIWDTCQVPDKDIVFKEFRGLWGWVLDNRKPLLTNTPADDPRSSGTPPGHIPIHRFLSAPAVIGETLVGQVAVANSDHDYTERDLALVERLAALYTIAVQRKWAEEALQQTNVRLALVNQISRRLSAILDVDQLLTEVVQLVRDSLGYDYVSVALAEGDEIVFQAVAGGDQPVPPGFRLKVGQGIVGWVAAHGKALLMPDVTQDTHYYPRWPDTRSELAVPIQVADRILGALNVESDQLAAFDKADEALLQAIADQVAVAIENARLYQAEQRRAEQCQVISAVGRHMTSILTVDELLEEIARLLKETLGYYLVGIALIEGDELIFKAGAGAIWEIPDFQPPRLKVGGEGITGCVARSGEPLLVPDVSREPRYYALPEASEIRSELAVPLKAKEAVIGVLHVQSDHLNAFDESDQVVLQSLAHQAAMAIQNAQLYQQATESASSLEAVNRRLLALNRVGLRAQEAFQVEDILAVVVNELKELGFNSVILLREDDSLVFRHTSIEPALQAAAEEVVGVKMVGYAMPMDTPPLQPLVEAKATLFIAEPLQPIAEALSSLAGPGMDEALEMLGVGRAIAAPLIARDRVTGLLAIWSPDLEESDVPAVTAFAHQMAIAVENARLYEETREKSEQLNERVEQLERFRKATVQREFRMVELKGKIKELEERLNQ